jgi:hypothetical protein
MRKIILEGFEAYTQQKELLDRVCQRLGRSGTMRIAFARA